VFLSIFLLLGAFYGVICFVLVGKSDLEDMGVFLAMGVLMFYFLARIEV